MKLKRIRWTFKACLPGQGTGSEAAASELLSFLDERALMH